MQRSDRRPAAERPPTKRAGGAPRTGGRGKARITATKITPRRLGGGVDAGAVAPRGIKAWEVRARSQQRGRAAHGWAGQGAQAAGKIQKAEFIENNHEIRHLRNVNMEIYSGVTNTANGLNSEN